MNESLRTLINGFPRTVSAAVDGDLIQHYVHSEREMEVFIEHNKPDKNLYFSIARMRQDMRPVTGLVSFDFDSPLEESIFDDDITDGEKIRRMREDSDVAYKVLGQVWDDTQSLVRECREQSIPVICVFSGLGVHAHLLYQERVNPVEEKTTTSLHFVEECGLETWDRKVISDTKRILRVPNSQRIDERGSTGTWCIPMTESEVVNNSLMEMLNRCTEPKSIPIHSRYREENRPRMQAYEDVDFDESETGSVEMKGKLSDIPDDVEYIVRNCIPLPCVRERFLTRNPSHYIRFSAVCFLFQSGFSPDEVQKIISQLNWVDYDKQTTRKQVKNIWKNRYSELSCSRLQRLGLCVYGPEFEQFSNDKEDCETYNYTSGEALYPYE
jgi:hypothetical protein